jgi:uncharacterized protein (UPF0276 family)
MQNKTGIGCRREFAEQLVSENWPLVDFVEIAPENWMQMGGHWKQVLNKIADKYPITCHGLSLSIGSPDELNLPFLKALKTFLDEYNVELYSEHLSFSSCDNAHVYDLLPIPFQQAAIDHIVPKIQQVQDLLKRPLVLENVSYYTAVADVMSESEFISEIVKQSGCKLLLDVNNVFVNAFNHKYEPKAFILELPLDQVEYIHIAGHEKINDQLIIDTHGQSIIDPVFELLKWVQNHIKPVPVLLERDFNIPHLKELMQEMTMIKNCLQYKA